MTNAVPRAFVRRPVIQDREFWIRDLRLGRYDEVLRLINDARYREECLVAWFRTRRALTWLARRLDVHVEGTTDALRARIVATETACLPYLLVAAFGVHKSPSVVAEVAAATLPVDVLEASRDNRGRYDPLLLLLHLFDVAPETLAHVRGLDAWRRHRAVSLVLDGWVAPPERPIASFLTSDHVEAAIANVPRPPGVPPVRFEMAIARPGEGVVLILRRNLRRAHCWSDDGTQIAHGHDEELIMLHFLDEGRRLRLSSATERLPRDLANAIASSWFDRPCVYVEDLLVADPAAVRRMAVALVEGPIEGLRVVELAVRNAPLNGAPELVITAPDPSSDITPALESFQQCVGPLVEQIEDIVYVRLAFGDRRILVDFPRQGNAPAVRFIDGKLPLRDADAFRTFVTERFGLTPTGGRSLSA